MLWRSAILVFQKFSKSTGNFLKGFEGFKFNASNITLNDFSLVNKYWVGGFKPTISDIFIEVLSAEVLHKKLNLSVRIICVQCGWT